MPITVKITKRSADGRPALYATRDLDVLPASIGRDPACTIALEDPNKHMSRFHVEITEESGTYWMSVVSKVNPVMVKGRRYGPGTRLTLQSGDTFELAEYEVQVLVPEPEPEPELTEPGSPERLFNEATFLGRDDAPEETYIPQKAKVEPASPLRAFLEGAGLAPKELPPAEAERMLREGGAILRAAVEGIVSLLLARAGTRAHDGNPLKMVAGTHEAMDFLLDSGERTGGLPDPVQAVRDACEELGAHEMALRAGMRAAVMAALRRFEPDSIERSLERNGGGFSLASRKARLWDAYVAEQRKLAREAHEDFDKAFGADFLDGYQAELRRLKGGR